MAAPVPPPSSSIAQQPPRSFSAPAIKLRTSSFSSPTCICASQPPRRHALRHVLRSGSHEPAQLHATTELPQPRRTIQRCHSRSSSPQRHHHRGTIFSPLQRARPAHPPSPSTSPERRARRSSHHVGAAAVVAPAQPREEGASGNPNLGERRSCHVSSSQWTLNSQSLSNLVKAGQTLVKFWSIL